MPNMTDAYLRNLPLPERGQVTYSDDTSPLKLRASQGGAKTFFVTLDGTGRRHVIGRYGEITLQQARSAAKQLRAEKTLGRIIPTPIRLSKARNEYLDSLTVRPATKSYYKRHLNRLPGTKLQDSTPREINRLLDALSPSSRLQGLRSYTAFFGWCISRHYLEKSPCERMEAETIAARDRVLSDEELSQVWDAAGDCGQFGVIVKLLILTGQRRGEIGALQKTWLDLEDHKITLPKELCKNGREHCFPIGALSKSLLSPYVHRATDSVLFTGRGSTSTPFSGWSKSKIQLDEISGVTNWTLHDLRRTFATGLAKLGTPIHVVEKLLNHVSGSTSGLVGIYQRHEYWDEQIKAVNAWNDHLERLFKNC